MRLAVWCILGCGIRARSPRVLAESAVMAISRDQFVGGIIGGFGKVIWTMAGFGSLASPTCSGRDPDRIRVWVGSPHKSRDIGEFGVLLAITEYGISRKSCVRMRAGSDEACAACGGPGWYRDADVGKLHQSDVAEQHERALAWGQSRAGGRSRGRGTRAERAVSSMSSCLVSQMMVATSRAH